VFFSTLQEPPQNGNSVYHPYGNSVYHYHGISVYHSTRNSAYHFHLTIFLLEDKHTDILDGLPVQPKMIGHVLDSQHLAEFEDIVGQSLTNPLVRREEFQLLHHDSLTLMAENLSILRMELYPGRSEIQVSNRSFLLAMDLWGWTSAEAADGMESFVVENDSDPNHCGFRRNGLAHNSD
jgi:hypothetical protein